MKKYLWLLILSSLFSCSEDRNSNSNLELSGKTFDHLWFESEQQCIDAQPDPNFFINCHRELHFIDDDTAELMLTDMTITVSYQIEENRVIINFTNNNSLTFEIIDDSSFKLLDDNTIWNERVGNSIWD